MKKTFIEIAKALSETSKNCLEKTGSYGRVTGAYEYMLADLVADLPLAKQEQFLRSLANTNAYISENT